MKFGNEDIYAIEVYHQPQDNNSFFMSGRMCIYLKNKMFGDIEEKYCHLFGPYDTFIKKIKYLDELEHDFNIKNDINIFKFLDEKLYILKEDDKRSIEQIRNDMKPFIKFDFMTNSGESFDRTKSFIYMDLNKKIHIMFETGKYNEKAKRFEDEEIICNVLDKEIFKNVTKDFISWYENIEKK